MKTPFIGWKNPSDSSLIKTARLLCSALQRTRKIKMSASKLTKELYTDINKLKNLNVHTQPKFILDQSPFPDDDDDQGTSTAAATTPKEIVIIGRILPDSEVYNQGAYSIEIKLTPNYPFDPPEVRFLTKIYHPNVAEDGQFCHEILKKTAKWSHKISLIDVIKAVIKHIDEPDIDYSLSPELGREYLENRAQFQRKALDFVKKHALSRT